jgi:hypothetical protein
MNIWLTIDYHGDGVLCFDPGKVPEKVEEYFPQVEIDPIGYGWEEAERFTEFADDGLFHDSDASIINQIRGKYGRNSPTYKFKVKTDNTAEINGHARRYSVRFTSENIFDAATEKRIIEFPGSLKYGEIYSDTKTDNFCVPKNILVNKWILKTDFPVQFKTE